MFRFLLLFLLFFGEIALSNNALFAKSQSSQKNASTKKINRNPLIIISCSGKSGSSTLLASFKNLNFETIRIHQMAESTYSFVDQRAKTAPVVLIDSIRDIISRKIASYFNNLHLHLSLSSAKLLSEYNTNPHSFLNFLQQDFKGKLISIDQYYSFSHWRKLGYDCLEDEAFDFDRKFQFKKSGNFYFVNLRFNEIQEWENIIKSIDLPLDLRNFKIVKDNISETKWYSDLYQEFLKNFTLTQEDFDAILSNNAKEMAHFYTDAEVQDFIEKWRPFITNP